MKRNILIFCLIFAIALGTLSCRKQPNEFDIASRLVMKILNIPNDQVKKAIDNTNPTNTVAAEKEIESAISNLAGGLVAEKTLKDPASSFHNYVIDLHYSAVIQNFTIKPSNVKVTQNATQKINILTRQP
jgi:sRNA-binding carbon storage regulator CsrA